MNTNEQKYIELQKRIDAYLNGDLSQQEVDELWADLISNPDYYNYFSTYVHLKKYYADQQQSTQFSDTSEKEASVHKLIPTKYWYIAAAAILVAVLSVNLLKMHTGYSLTSWAVDEIPSSDIESPDIMRSDTGKTRKSDSLLNLGYHATITGDINEAENIYATIINKYNKQSSAIQAHLNLGILKYNEEEYKEAIGHFKSVIDRIEKDEGRMLEKAYWYLGNSYVNIDKLQDARDAVYNAWTMNGIYRKPAERLLKKLDYELGAVNYDNFEEQRQSY